MQDFVSKDEFVSFKQETNQKFIELNKKLTPIQEIQITSAKILERIESIDKNHELKDKLIEEKINPIKEKVEKVEDNNKWLWRTVGATIIGLVLNYLIKIIS